MIQYCNECMSNNQWYLCIDCNEHEADNHYYINGCKRIMLFLFFFFFTCYFYCSFFQFPSSSFFFFFFYHFFPFLLRRSRRLFSSSLSFSFLFSIVVSSLRVLTKTGSIPVSLSIDTLIITHSATRGTRVIAWISHQLVPSFLPLLFTFTLLTLTVSSLFTPFLQIVRSFHLT